MAPIVHGLEVEYFGRVNFVYLDIDNPANDDFKQVLGYRVQPNLFLLDREGNIILQWLGVVTAEELRAAFDSAIQ